MKKMLLRLRIEEIFPNKRWENTLKPHNSGNIASSVAQLKVQAQAKILKKYIINLKKNDNILMSNILLNTLIYFFLVIYF